MSNQKRISSGLTVILLLTTLSVITLARGSAERPETRLTGSIPSRDGLSALLQGRVVRTASFSQQDTTPSALQFPVRSNTPLALSGNVAFETDRGWSFDVYAQNADGSGAAVPVVVSPGADYTPAWSPDGTQMLFASDRDGDFEVYLRTADGAEFNLTQNPADDAHPAWSPGGDRIIFTSNRGGDYFQVFTMDPDGSDVQQVGVVPGNNAMHPRYSPDGSRVAFMRASITEPLCEWNWDVWVMDADGGNQERVTSRLNADLYPNWTPDGTEIVYASCDNWLDFDLYAVNPDTGAERQLTSWLWDNEWGAVYSPDGDYLAFNTDVDGNTEVYVAPATGGTASNLTQNSAEDLAPSWASQAAPTTYSISGRVTDPNGDGLGGVTVADDKGHTALTQSNGDYALSGLATGTYQVTPSADGYDFIPTSRQVSVPPDAAGQDFTATAALPPSAGPIILVHGWQGLDFENGGNQCTDQPDLWQEGSESYFGPFAAWLHETYGYEVWLANLDTGPLYTPPIEENAECLNQQVQYVAVQEGRGPVILISHSMGGLVSRACLNLDDCRANVTDLYTLGSPHAGVNSLFLLKLLAAYKLPTVKDIVCAWQPALCQFSTDGVLWFNLSHPNREPVDYGFIGGTATPFPWGWLLWLFDGVNDGAVGSYSAVGWFYPTGRNVVLGKEAVRYWTGETHSEGLGYPSYFQASGGEDSQAFRCVAWLMGKRVTADCEAATSSMIASQAEPSLSAATIDVSGHLAGGQIATHPMQVDAEGKSLFYLSWLTGTLSFTLTQPGGQVITPAYADSHPDIVAYTYYAGDSATPPYATYAFTSTAPGVYTLTVGADVVGDDGADYLGSVLMETERSFSIVVNADLYQVGQTAVFTGSLQGPGGPITGATVQATLVRPDGITETLTLDEQGNGVYVTHWPVPDAPGYARAAFTAVGEDEGTAFTRQTDALLSVAPHGAQLAGSYADRADDQNGDGFNDALALDVAVTASGVGTYTLSANLATEGQTVAHAGQYTNLALGTHTVTLRFDGWDIRRSRLNGPYTVTNVHLVDVGVGGIPAQIAQDVWTTAAYDWRDFGFDSLYLPLVVKDR